jgi:hypothetical protein
LACKVALKSELQEKENQPAQNSSFPKKKKGRKKGEEKRKKAYCKSVNHGLETKVNLTGADDFGDILTSVVSKETATTTHIYNQAECFHTLGSLGSRRATLMPCSAKYPLAWAR